MNAYARACIHQLYSDVLHYSFYMIGWYNSKVEEIMLYEGNAEIVGRSRCFVGPSVAYVILML